MANFCDTLGPRGDPDPTWQTNREFKNESV